MRACVTLYSHQVLQVKKEQGDKGAGGVSSRVNNLFKWSATTHEVEKWNPTWKIDRAQS